MEEQPTKSVLLPPHAACSLSWGKQLLYGEVKKVNSKTYLLPTSLMGPAAPFQHFPYCSFFPPIIAHSGPYLFVFLLCLQQTKENLISGTLYSIPGMFFYRRSYDIPIWALLKCYFHRELLSNSHVLFYCLLHLSSKHHSQVCKAHTPTHTHTYAHMHAHLVQTVKSFSFEYRFHEIRNFI